MITYVHGSIFESPASVLVNTVNTVGVMGRGIAADFKRLYPEMFRRYQQLCEEGKLRIGTLWLYRTEHKSVLNFPTKTDWRRPSKPEYVEEGLRTFLQTYEKAAINSIAFPALGCGNGGLDFEKQVRPLMERYLSRVAASVFIYPHQGSMQVPEHIRPAEMGDWLRSAPEDLSFVEVWEDLRKLLGRQRTFRTLAADTEYRALYSADPLGIRIVSGSKKWLVPQQDLLDFWQHLRAFGFVSSRDAPSGRERDTSYIAPVFAELPYVRVARIAKGYEAFERTPEYALQLTPRSGKAVASGQLELISTAS